MSHDPVSTTHLSPTAGLATAQPSLGAGHGLLQAPVDIHPALEEVRRMKEFQPPQPNPLDEIWKQPWVKKILAEANQALEQALLALKKLFSGFHPERMAHLPENIRDIASLLIGFVIVLAGLYALYLLLTLLLRWKQNQPALAGKPERVFERTLLVDSGHHYQQAQAAAENADYAQGVRELYIATLCLLDERTIIPFENARTNLEYQAGLEQLQPKPQAQQGLGHWFAKLAMRFERTRYGRQPADQTQFDQSYEAYAQFRESLGTLHG